MKMEDFGRDGINIKGERQTHTHTHTSSPYICGQTLCMMKFLPIHGRSRYASQYFSICSSNSGEEATLVF